MLLLLDHYLPAITLTHCLIHKRKLKCESLHTVIKMCLPSSPELFPGQQINFMI